MKTKYLLPESFSDKITSINLLAINLKNINSRDKYKLKIIKGILVSPHRFIGFIPAIFRGQNNENLDY